MTQNTRIFCAALLMTLIFTACGGGGDGAVTKKTPPSASKPAADLRVIDRREIELDPLRILSLSPDGRLLAAEDPDQLCIYQTESLAEQACALLRERARPALSSFVWSPDSTRIAFTDEVFKHLIESDLWVMQVKVGTLTNLTDDGVVGNIFNPEPAGAEPLLDAVPAWSPDGRTLLFSRTAHEADQERRTDLFRIPAGGGDPEKVLTVSDELLFVVWYGLRWSDDGKNIFYNVLKPKPDDPDTGVWTAERDGKNPRQLVGVDPEMGSPALVDVSERADKALLYYPAAAMSNPQPNVSYYVLLDLKTGAVEPLKRAKGDQIEFLILANATFSPDGSKVLYVYGDAEKKMHLAVRDLDEETENLLFSAEGPLGLQREFGLGLDWAEDDTIYAATSFSNGLLIRLGTE